MTTYRWTMVGVESFTLDLLVSRVPIYNSCLSRGKQYHVSLSINSIYLHNFTTYIPENAAIQTLDSLCPASSQ